MDLVLPVSRPHDPEVDKSAFQIDLEARRATCPLFARCVRRQSAGRTVRTHAHEVHVQEARQRQQTDAFHVLYRLRDRVEGKIAELVGHGLRETRYLGEQKGQLQRLWTGAAVNLKRLFKLAQTKDVDLGVVSGGLSQRQMALAPG